MQRRRPLLLTALLTIASCARPGTTGPLLGVEGSPEPPAGVLTARDGWAPPSNWRTLSTIEFEHLLATELPPDVVTPPGAAALDRLAAALGEDPGAATRAALLLARTSHPAAHRRLLERLEQRVLGPLRASDAGDCTSAAALARGPIAAETAERLAQLAVGPKAHPDLEVRTECATAALALGREEVVPYLLAVLRIDTDDALERGEHLTDSPNTAWARGRAAQALCDIAGIEHRVWTDASLPERERHALELETLLLK
ncbi:hypothetical protein [Engelhardtia mirabilis]|uniref:HEAT repeat protein n=1 Tax=Engelhardtia mirabilis TaxID=2528011 RepID=A0A518BJZ6_9BACT|nr:hypothetical protein Pla133_23730 [Planctomycetes bacterium Pla133]QDV01620.1 hypothetical protein Pla86_23720 [Planctomycetes bacterium Pla86]